MKYTELHKLHKQLGNKIIEFKNGHINGYTVLTYVDYIPDTLQLDKTVIRPDTVLSFDGAYDLLYGTPQAPDFTKVLNGRA